jgi:cell division protein FtsQ
MTVSRNKSVHGAAYEAPPEEGFLAGSSRNGRNKPGNRPRRDPELDLRPEASRVWRGVGSALKLVSGVIVVVLASAVVAWGAYRYALTTPRFAVRHVEIKGSRRLADEQIAKLTGVELGRNMFQIDTDDAERRVLREPWVREVKITRQLPSTLRIELVERQAFALAAISDQLYLVTKTGEPFKRVEPADPYDLPVITGISPDGLARDRRLEIERIGRAIEVLRTYERVPLSRVHPAQEVNLNDEGMASLTIGSAGITLQLGKGPWRKKLLMGARVLGQLGPKGRLPGIIFLDNQAHPERVVVRLR